MNQKIFGQLLLGAASVLAAQPASALSPSFYLGALGGQATNGVDEGDVASTINRRGGHNITVETGDDGLGLGVYGGWWFMPHAAVEVGYLRLEEVDTEISGTTQNPGRLATDIAAVLPAQGGNAATLALRMDIPIAGPVNLAPRFGGVALFTTRDVNGQKDESTSLGILAGLGLDARLVGSLHIGLGFQVIAADENASQTLFYGALEYRFERLR